MIYSAFDIDEIVALRVFTLNRHAPLGIENNGDCNVLSLIEVSAVPVIAHRQACAVYDLSRCGT